MVSQEIYLSSICERLTVERLQERRLFTQDIPRDKMLHYSGMYRRLTSVTATAGLPEEAGEKLSD